MKIHVLYFAQLKEYMGIDRETIEISYPMSAREFGNWLMDQKGMARFKTIPVAYAVNEQFTDGRTTLNDEDIVALLMPVAGG